MYFLSQIGFDENLKISKKKKKMKCSTYIFVIRSLCRMESNFILLFMSNVLTSNHIQNLSKKQAFLLNNFTMISPHKIDSSLNCLQAFYSSFILPNCSATRLRNLGHKWKGCDFWHNIHKV